MPVRVTPTGRRANSGVAVTFEGPFFERDPALTFRQNIRRFMDRVADAGGDIARERAQRARRKDPGPSYSASFIVGRTRSLTGKRWAVTAVISPRTDRLDAASAKRVMASLAGRHDPITKRGADPGRNIGTMPGHEGTDHVFRATANDLRRVVAANVDTLLEGIS